MRFVVVRWIEDAISLGILPPVEGSQHSIVDTSIYATNREFRLPWSVKIKEDKRSTLHFVGSNEDVSPFAQIDTLMIPKNFRIFKSMCNLNFKALLYHPDFSSDKF